MKKIHSSIYITKSQSIMLDLARALSAQLVLIGYAIETAGFEQKYLIQNLGAIGFFVLSGYLVTFSVLNKPSTYSFLEYLIDRGSRIFVPLLPAIAFIVLS